LAQRARIASLASETTPDCLKIRWKPNASQFGWHLQLAVGGVHAKLDDFIDGRQITTSAISQPR
jgi:hypothetical protein